VPTIGNVERRFVEANSPGKTAAPTASREENDGQEKAETSGAHGDSFKITLSPEGVAALAAGGGVTTLQIPPPPPPFPLPPVVVESISTKAWGLEQLLRSQQNPSVPDYGRIGLEVGRYYQSQYALAYQGVAWANQHVAVDPALNLNDPDTKERVQQIKDQVAAMAYEGLSNPNKIVNGPDANDITAGTLMNRLQNTNIAVLSGYSPNGSSRGGEASFNSNGTTTIKLYPDAWPAFFAGTNTPTWAQATTVTFHEIGHALNRAEFEAASASGTPPAAWTEGRAIAMGHGAAELAGATIGQGYSTSAQGVPEAPR